MGEVEGGVDFVEDVHGRGGVLEEGEDEGEGDEGSVLRGVGDVSGGLGGGFGGLGR